MNRQTFNAMCAQYATPEASGDGLVSWEHGKKCVIPSVKLYGAAVQDGEPTPENPVMPVCNNGVFASRGRNLFDLAGRVQRKLSGFSNTTPREFDGHSYYVGLTANGYYSSGDVADYSIEADVGAVMVHASNSGHGLAFDFPAVPGKTYTVSAVSDQNIAVSWYDADGYLISYGASTSPRIVKAPANARWLIVLFRPTVGAAYVYADVQLESGSTATPYTPYYDGGQAQAPELWAIPGTEYRDEWNPQTGRGIRRVRKIMLDGVSDVPKFYEVIGTKTYWNLRLFARNDNTGNAANGIFCSHIPSKSFAYNPNQKFHFLVKETGVSLGFATVDDLNNFCAEQYSAGTPVTVWYALAEPEPFYSPPAKLTMPTGYGQIIQVSGDVPDCPITARYLTHS